MAWADIKLLEFLQHLPSEALKAKAAPDEWDVAHLIFHMIASADWYAFELGRTLHFTQDPDSLDGVLELGGIWREFNKYLLAECDKEDEVVTYFENGKEFKVMRSTVLAQDPIHSVEHRTQITLALKINGFPTLELEDYSQWGFVYESSQK